MPWIVHNAQLNIVYISLEDVWVGVLLLLLLLVVVVVVVLLLLSICFERYFANCTH